MLNPGVKDCPVTVDQNGKQPDPIPPKKIDLHDAHAIRREMASVYRDMKSGVIDYPDGSRLVYVLDTIRKAFETGELQNRLESLEMVMKQRKKT